MISPTLSPVLDRDPSVDVAVNAARLVRTIRHQIGMPAGMRVLALIDETGPVGISQLAFIDECSQPTMSAAVASLVAQGYVIKTQSATDARSNVVSITEYGYEALAEFRESMARIIRDRLAMSGHGDEDVATTASVLQSILDAES